MGSNPTSSASATSSSAERDDLPNGAVNTGRGYRWGRRRGSRPARQQSTGVAEPCAPRGS